MTDDDIDISQDNLLKKLIEFLQHEKRSLSRINSLKASKGLCFGLTMFKIYCEEQPENQKGINNAARFIKIATLIANYNPQKFDTLDEKTREKQRKEINEFMSHVFFMQNVGAT